MNELTLFAKTACLPDGWADNVTVQVNSLGRIVAVHKDSHDASATDPIDVLLPGVPNAHSHAFQRGLAGLTEYQETAQSDDFWSWRETMYRFVAQLRPEDVHAMARQVYVEMLRHGYTSVCEFHYLHHDPEGHPYPALTELAARHLQAAREVGIRLTMLPVLYSHGGFDGRGLQGGQRRFRTDVAMILAMIRQLQDDCAHDPTAHVGLAVHSLRAATVSQIGDVLSELRSLGSRDPVHLHIAEQTAEVEQCVARHGKRPVEYLASQFDLSGGWSLVHATHVSQDELRLLADSRCVVVLCPVTEANLGDGLFPLTEFFELGGRFAIGSDSQIAVAPWEELRMLEHTQRLARRRRNLLAVTGRSTGASLLQQVVEAGACAAGHQAAGITPGGWADLIAVDSQHAQMAGRTRDTIVDTLVFCANACFIRDVFVGGRRVIQDGQHPAEQDIAADYRESLRRLLQDL